MRKKKKEKKKGKNRVGYNLKEKKRFSFWKYERLGKKQKQRKKMVLNAQKLKTKPLYISL